MTAWDFAVAAWKRPAIEAVCLELQTQHGQSAALILWRLWALAQRRPVAAETLAQAVAAARDWELNVLAPLRATRGYLRSRPAAPEIEDLHQRVLGAELAAERILLDALEALTPTSQGPVEASLPALVGAAEAWRSPPAQALLARLIAML